MGFSSAAKKHLCVKIMNDDALQTVLLNFFLLPDFCKHRLCIQIFLKGGKSLFTNCVEYVCMI